MRRLILRCFVAGSLLIVTLPAAEQNSPARKRPAQASTGGATETAGTIASPTTLITSVNPATLNSAVPRLIKFSGVLTDAAGVPHKGQTASTFAIYAGEQDAVPLWIEKQNVEPDEQGRYTVILGAASPYGIPADLFGGGEHRWLGMRPETKGEEEQPRILLVSVPYALKAADADTLNGKPLSAFMLAEPAAPGADAQAAAGAAASSGTGSSQAKPAAAGPGINAAGTANYVAKFDGSGNPINSMIYETTDHKIGSAQEFDGVPGNIGLRAIRRFCKQWLRTSRTACGRTRLYGD